MLQNPSDRLIPWNTRLSSELVPQVAQAIERREKMLRRRRLDVETSLWLMDELAHLRKLLAYNQT